MVMLFAAIPLAFALAATPTPAPGRTPAPSPARTPSTVFLKSKSDRFSRAAGDPLPYTGSPISLNLTSADLRDVLQMFAKISGLNLVIYPEVKGTVTVTLKDVPWDQALELILLTNGYGYVIEGRVMRIRPLKRLIE